jgi:hypothetical protein
LQLPPPDEPPLSLLQLPQPLLLDDELSPPQLPPPLDEPPLSDEQESQLSPQPL